VVGSESGIEPVLVNVGARKHSIEWLRAKSREFEFGNAGIGGIGGVKPKHVTASNENSEGDCGQVVFDIPARRAG